MPRSVFPVSPHLYYKTKSRANQEMQLQKIYLCPFLRRTGRRGLSNAYAFDT
jgi:hypothetical protein